MNPARCPSCDFLEDWPENPLKPYCSEVCLLLWRHGLAWRVQPCRIVVASHPHLVVQKGLSFDLREQTLKGARQRELSAERKRRQRVRDNTQEVTPTAQYNPPVEVHLAISGPENHPTEGNLDPAWTIESGVSDTPGLSQDRRTV